MVKIVNTSEENYSFLKSYFKKFVTNLDKFLTTSSYKVCEYRSDSGFLIGCSFFVIHDNYIHLNASLISDSFRGLGINKEMKQCIIKYADSINGIKKITCNVRESNVKSMKSLLNIGFKINNNVDMIYPDGEKKIAMYYEL